MKPIKLTDLKPDIANANAGSERGLRALDDSIAQAGLGRSIVVDKDYNVIAGNKTLERAVDQGFEDAIVIATRGDKLVVVVREDLDLYDNDPNNRARKLAYADNRVAELDLSWDAEQLFADLQSGFDFDGLFDQKELDELFAEIEQPEPTPDAGAQVDRAEELQQKWQVERGQIWVIPSAHGNGEHRLMCGDSTDADDVSRLLGENKPRLMVTDPPYGVEYDQEWRSSNRVGKVANDNRAGWLAAYKLSPAEVIYVWHANMHAIQVFEDLLNSGFELRNQIVWNKPRHVFSQGHYHWKHEPCFYMVRKGSTAQWAGDRKQNTVWDIDADDDAPGNHSTQKPLECMARPIRNHLGDVYDPFGGSGTTMVASEQMKRICYMMELEPKYVSSILERLVLMGLEPTLE